jgi:hypothetical protein
MFIHQQYSEACIRGLGAEVETSLAASRSAPATRLAEHDLGQPGFKIHITSCPEDLCTKRWYPDTLASNEPGE